MRLVNYEKKKLVFGFVFCLFVLFIGIFFYTWFRRINTYVILEGRVRGKNYIELMVPNDKFEVLYKNKTVYIEDVKKKFVISDVSKDVLENKKMKYSLVVLEVSLSLMDNEFVTLVFCDKKVKLFKIFSVIWEGD